MWNIYDIVDCDFLITYDYEVAELLLKAKRIKFIITNKNNAVKWWYKLNKNIINRNIVRIRYHPR